MRRLSQWIVTLVLLLAFVVVAAQAKATGSAAPTILAAAVPTAEADSEPKTVSESWDVIHFGENRIGYAHSTIREVTRDRRTLYETETETRMVIKRFGQKLNMRTALSTEETAEGELLSFVFEMHNPPAATTRTAGTVEGELLRLETTTAGTTRRSAVKWDPDVKSPSYQDRLLRNTKLEPGKTLQLKAYLPDFNSVATITLEPAGPANTKLFDGESRKLMQVNVRQSVPPNMPPVRAYVDDEGVPLKTETNFLGNAMVTYKVSREEALKSIAGTELDLAANTLIPVAPIPRAHTSKSAVYRIQTSDDDPAAYLVDGGTQSIKRVDDETIDLTVTSVRPPRDSKNSKSPKEYLASTRYLQCDDTGVAEHARRAASGLIDPAQVALRMEAYVHEKLTEKNFSTALASAAEVADSLEGDCTEHAVLLAGMLRARDIPSRVAVGLVYVPSKASFGGHMWTEALLGDEWIPLDATLGQGGIGAAHIKLGDSSFADDAPAPITAFLPLLRVLGNMQIHVIRMQ